LRLDAIAELAGLLVEDGRKFDCPKASRQRGGKDVITLAGIETAKLLPENSFEIGEEGQAADAVIHEVEVTADVGVPDKPLVLAGQVLDTQMEGAARQEVNGLRVYGRRAGATNDGAQRHHHASDHSVVPSPSAVAISRASCASSASIRRFNSGKRRNTTDALRHSRLSIAG